MRDRIPLAAALLVVASVVPLHGQDLRADAACPPRASRGLEAPAPVRLACSCFPRSGGAPAAWWPLQIDARDYCGTAHGDFRQQGATFPSRSYSLLGIRGAVDVFPGLYVEIPSSDPVMAGMPELTLAAVVNTTTSSKPILTKAIEGTDRGTGELSFAFRIEEARLVLELYGPRASSRDSCVAMHSNQRLRQADLRNSSGVLVSAVWSGVNQAAFYVGTRPVGGALVRACKQSVGTIRPSTAPLWIGASAKRQNDDTTFNDGFTGQIRDVVLYRGALERYEICQLADLLTPREQPSSCASPRR